ncbi:uncharacterized protein LOC128223183 [Mya arenaria]|uniref:uncharacterized protein LOC128223183 n=1 Tax=Mya arenaria TaxID=6604 RepID=UPI0022E38AD5|nr:uncharacterized protein LOC128223183 [Mya arenaria]
MSGFPQPMKRPYPGDWGAPPRPPKDPRAPDSGYPPAYPPQAGAWGSAAGGYGGGGYPGSYGGYDYGQKEYSQNWSGYAKQEPPQPAPVAGPPRDESFDFTDDYAAFYGKGTGDRGRGGGRGRGRGRGQRGGPRGGGSTNNTVIQTISATAHGSNRGTGGAMQRGGAQSRGGPQGRGRGRGQDQRGRGGNNRGRGAQRGMPPNHFGRGRGGNQRGGFLPPVHSLAKAQPNLPDLSSMSMAEKLHRFCLFLRNDDSIKQNAIQTIMNGITSSKLGLRADYQAEELTRVAGKAMYTGVLRLNDIFLARAIRPNKKELKQEVFQKGLNVMLSMTVAEIYNMVDPGADAIRVFQKGLNVMLSMTVAEIYNMVDPGADAIRDELDRQIKEDEKNPNNAAAKSLIGVDVTSTLSSLIQAIHNMKNIPDNPISYIEQAATQAHCLIKHQYSSEMIKLQNGRTYYKGALNFGNIVIGRGTGLTKKACKHDTYEQTLERLKTKTMAQLSESAPEIKIEEDEAMFPAVGSGKDKLTNMSLEQRFHNLLTALLGSSGFRGPTNNVQSTIDVQALQNGLVPMLIFRHEDENNKDTNRNTIIELYIEKILISSSCFSESETQKKKECLTQLYTMAHEVLTTVPAEQILTQHRRIPDSEIKTGHFIDIIIKGSGRTVESNGQALKRFGFAPEELEGRSLDELVIIEHSDWSRDRVRNAFSILQLSCTQNGLLMQWECDCVKNYFRCVISIQKRVVGESYGSNKNHARNLAATDALFKLYETQEVVNMASRLEDHKKWITWKEIQEEAEKLRTAGIGDEPIMKNDEQGNPLPDAFVMKVLKDHLSRLTGGEVREVLFGPGIGVTETREIRYFARMQKLKSDVRQYQGEPYLLFYEKLEWPRTVEILKSEEGPYGKFVLVDRSTLPNHATIEKNLVKEIPHIGEELLDAAIEKAEQTPKVEQAPKVEPTTPTKA